MIVRGLSSTRDWLFGKGRNDYKRDADAVTQNIDTRLHCFLGDCFFDVNAGLAWFDLMGSKGLVELRLAISTVILNTAEVTSLIELSVVLDENRNVTIQYSVDTVYGVVYSELGISLFAQTKELVTEDLESITTEDDQIIIT